jgi:hypothetical protein
VTIVERVNGLAPAPRAPMRPHTRPIRRRKVVSPARSEEGTIETFTILYVTPDGFLPPLALALIRDRAGAVVMAQGEDIAHLKIGREVFLRQLDGGYIFTVKTHLDQVKQALDRLLRAVPRGDKKTRAEEEKR